MFSKVLVAGESLALHVQEEGGGGGVKIARYKSHRNAGIARVVWHKMRGRSRKREALYVVYYIHETAWMSCVVAVQVCSTSVLDTVVGVLGTPQMEESYAHLPTHPPPHHPSQPIPLRIPPPCPSAKPRLFLCMCLYLL